MTPADGWYSAADVWDVGPTGLSLQKAGAYVAFWAEEYIGTNDELMAEMVDHLERAVRVVPRPAGDCHHGGRRPARADCRVHGDGAVRAGGE